MKKWLTELCKTVFFAAVTAYVTILITGQPLTGLTELKGLMQILFKSKVPAWVFALALFVALFGLYDIVTHFLKGRKPKGKVHFVPDAHNYGWAGNDGRTDVRAGGTFTYDGVGTLTVVNAFLKGTQPKSNMMVQVLTGNGLGPIGAVSSLDLPAHVPIRVAFNLWLTPVKAERGKPMRGQLVLRDPYNRDYYISPVDFPYIGQQNPKPAGV